MGKRKIITLYKVMVKQWTNSKEDYFIDEYTGIRYFSYIEAQEELEEALKEIKKLNKESDAYITEVKIHYDNMEEVK